MAYDIGVKLKIDGEREYRDAINQISMVNKTLDTELKAVTSSFTKNTTAEQKAAAQEKILQDKLTLSKEKLDLMRKGLEDARANYGDNTKQVQSWAQAVNNAQADVNKLTNQIAELGDAQQDNAKKSSTFGDVLKANLTSEAIIGAVKALVGAIKEVGTAMVDTALEAAQWADDLNTLSKTTGLSTDTLQEFEFMSKLVDVEVSTITGSLKKLVTNMKSAKKGTGTASDAFKKLGVKVTTANGTLRKSEDVFNDVIDALSEMEDGTERDALAMDIFGKSASELNPLIMAGSKTIKEYTKQAHDMGYVLSGETLNSLNAVQDNVDMLHNQMKTVKNTIATAVAPVVKQITQAFIDWSKSVDWQAVGKVISGVFNAVGNAVLRAVNTVTYIIRELVDFGNQCYALYNIVANAIGAIPNIFSNMGNNIRNIFSGIISSAWSWGSDMVSGFANGVTSHMNAVLDRVRSLANSIRSFLHFSRPDEGPLRNYEQWMPDFMQGLAKGIDQNSYLVENAISRVAGAMTINPSVGTANARGGITINLGGVTFNGYNAKQGNELVRELNKQLGRLY